MATYYPYQPQQNYPCALTMAEYIPIVSTLHAPMPFHTSPMPGPVPVSIELSTPRVNPYPGGLIAEPVWPSVISSNALLDTLSVPNAYGSIMSYTPKKNLQPEVDINNEQANQIQAGQIETEDLNNKDVQMNPLEFYLTLPKELFPTARMFTLDPNPIIDEFCKLVNINDNAPWILDLEFGIPRVPVTRAIPVYDVQFNSIHCKNTPGAIHPGFESCSSDFKRVFLFYYDCIISTWYKGYIIMNYDKSVKNFQSWLLIPMQSYGMCWR